ncbi:MAG: hypothetical protein ACRDZ5_11025, partial [Acidimicrobiales bacterium]
MRLLDHGDRPFGGPSRAGCDGAATFGVTNPSLSAWASARRSTARMIRTVFGSYPPSRLAAHVRHAQP